MKNESTAPARGAIDPAAIALIGTYAIDLTATTHSNIAVPDTLPTTGEIQPTRLSSTA